MLKKYLKNTMVSTQPLLNCMIFKIHFKPISFFQKIYQIISFFKKILIVMGYWVQLIPNMEFNLLNNSYFSVNTFIFVIGVNGIF
jgi:hypothetical protein